MRVSGDHDPYDHIVLASYVHFFETKVRERISGQEGEYLYFSRRVLDHLIPDIVRGAITGGHE
jgi:hypothetical protein